ncbi:MAG: hypothetical protein LUQ15_08555 [Methanothrix sp.]|nr:hypothetical protein [Methanothrix sp.]
MSSLSIAEGIIARLAGPMSLRLVIQPLMASLGIVDAKAGETLFIVGLITECEDRRAKLGSLFKSLSKAIIIAVVMEVIAQYLLFGQVHAIGVILYVFVFMIVPYSLVRAAANVIVTKRK